MLLSTFEVQFSYKKPHKNYIPNTMKKIIYIILIAFVTSLTLSSCTEEGVTPTEYSNGGGAPSSDKP